MTTTNHVRIGNSDPGSVKVGDNWDGGIDEVRIYNRAIEFSTIQMLGSRRGIAYETKYIMLGAAARSLGRYITAIGANGVPDPEVMTTHINAMHTLGMLSGAQHREREHLVEGLVRVVDKRLGRGKVA
jgi:hypothetical protein